jgi:hypothetical protein
MATLNSYTPGDFIINEMSIAGRAINNGFISGSIYESIFMPCVVAEFNVRDTEDALFSGLNLSGGESFNITLQTPGGKKTPYKFLVNKPENLQPSAGMKSRTMTLICTSEEAFYAAGGVSVNGYLQKSYKSKPISYDVQDVLKSYLKTSKPINIEVTKGNQDIIAQNEKVWAFIDRIRRRAVSSTNQSSSYVFFENQNGFNFVTIESLFSNQVVKTFVQDNSVGTDIAKLTDNNIFGYELPKMFNAVDRIDHGTMKSRFSTFNFETNEYIKKSIDFPDSKDISGGKNSWDNSSFISKFGKYPGRFSMLPYDNRLPITSIPDSTPNQLAYSGNLMQSLIKLRVFGDTKLKAGDLIEANIQNQNSLTGNQKPDSDISGKMIIASIRHLIAPEGERPRYSCVLECLKGRPR